MIYYNKIIIDDSIAKSRVDSWYLKHLEGKYSKYISDTLFCNDREEVREENGVKIYAGKDRLLLGKSPVLTCTQQNDRFTVNDEKNGNGDLTYPVALLTADEAVFAGAITSDFTTYLGKSIFWTMTPINLEERQSDMFLFYSSSIGLIDNFSDGSYEIRPVINLKSDVKFSGDGTIDNPYVIITE